MRLAWAIAVFATGCASASSPSANGGADANKGSGSNGADAKVFDDAPGHPIDAPGTHADASADAANIFQDAPPCTPTQSQLLANPAFDVTPTAWVQQPVPDASGGPYYPIMNQAIGPTPQSPAYKVFHGGLAGEDCTNGVSATDAIYQDVAIPAGTTALTLTGYYIVGSSEDPADTNVYDTFSMDLTKTDGTPIENVLKFTNRNAQTATTWNPFSHTFTANVAALSGTTVRLHMTSTNDVTNNSNFFFDTFALTATHCP